jgi:hypothetical protein
MAQAGKGFPMSYFEEYECGCVSNLRPSKRDLLGYCAIHGKDRRYIHTDRAFNKTAVQKMQQAIKEKKERDKG